MQLPEPVLRTMRFVLGTMYLLWLSYMLSWYAGVPYWQGLAAAGASLLVTFAVGVALAMWMAPAGSERPQFHLRSVLLLMVLASVYFALLRWLLAGSVQMSGRPTTQATAYTAWACVMMLAFSLPCWLLLSESLMWFAAWLVNRPPVQRLLRLLVRR